MCSEHSVAGKVILVLIDGLAWSAARDGMGYLQGLCEARRACLYRMESALPSLSRPLYECILTGVTPVESGIVNNTATRSSTGLSLFHLARRAGLTTAAAAYHWISELYNRSPYVPLRDRFTNDPTLPIQHGIFYHQDEYPDEHVLLDADTLRLRHDPDVLLIHPMNVDDAGHRHGYDSPQYRNSARRIDTLLSNHLPGWLAAGHQVLVTSDHGMNEDRTHGGTLPQERDIPLFVLGAGFSLRPDLAVHQTELCGLAASLLGLDHDKPFPASLLT